MKTIRSRAPLRLGIGGGGTDVSPYCDEHGGAVLNATINLFAHTHLILCEAGSGAWFEAADIGAKVQISSEADMLEHRHTLPLHLAVHRRFMRDFNNGASLPVHVTTHVDCPPGSGLGSSSALVVSMVAAYAKAMDVPLNDYELAHYAYDIERNDCSLAGGKQDQYASVFGGFNYIEFGAEDHVIVNSLRVAQGSQLELESSILIYFLGVSRDSGNVIKDQISITSSSASALDAMHQLKKAAGEIKNLLLTGQIREIGEEIRSGWEYKKATSPSVSSKTINDFEGTALEMGAEAMKISGAGGGGFAMLFCDPIKRHSLRDRLARQGLNHTPFSFERSGVKTWMAS